MHQIVFSKDIPKSKILRKHTQQFADLHRYVYCKPTFIHDDNFTNYRR